MKTKILSISLIALMLLSFVGSVSANEIGLWMSRKNDPGNHDSWNIIKIKNAHGYHIDKYGNEQELPLHYDWNQDISDYNNKGVYLTYEYPSTPITKVTLDFELTRCNKGMSSDRYYWRSLNFNMTFPVDGNWVCGINRNRGGTGMYFTADNHYEKHNEAKMDTVHCFFNDREAFVGRGGKFHEPQTFSVEFPNGRIWT